MSSRALVAVILASLGWGLSGVGVRTLFLEGASTFTVVALRTAVASAAVTVYWLASRKRISASAWRDGALIGVARIGLAPLFLVASLNYISAGFEGLVITLLPVMTAAMAHFMLGESLRPPQLAGVALGLGGTALMIASGETGIAGGSGSTVTGGLLALTGVFFGSLSGVLSNKYAATHDTGSLAVPMFLVGTALAVGVSMFSGDVDLPGLNAKSWQLLVLLGLASTLLPFAATLYAARHTTAIRAALPGYLVPVIAVVGGAVLLDEVITPAIMIGGTLTIAGVLLVSRGPDQRTDLEE